MKPVVTGDAVNDAMRRAFARGGLEAAKRCVPNLTDAQAMAIVNDQAAITGDSVSGFGFKSMWPQVEGSFT